MSKGKFSKIVGLELENFMSIKEAKLVFDDSNIINLKGYNDSGKSNIVRSLNVLLFDSYKRAQKNFIKHGEQYFRIKLHFDDGVAIVRDKYINGASLYEMYKDGELVFSTKVGSTLTQVKSVPLEIKEYLAMTETSEGSYLNSQSIYDKQFLIETTGSENVELLNGVLKLKETGLATTAIKNDINHLSSSINGTLADIEAIKISLSRYESLDEGYTYSLFCRERNREMEIWNGYRAGIDGAIDDYEADEAYAIDLLDEEIIEKLVNKQKLFYRIGHSSEFDVRVSKWIQQADAQQRRGNESPAQVIQLDRILDEIRLFKTPQEIELMQIASNISAKAHTRAMQTVHVGMMEYALEAELNYVFGQQGCVPAYNSIVGGGANACILHYVENNQELKDGDLVLIDAACEYELYASDITRTFPVNGKFSAEQKDRKSVV